MVIFKELSSKIKGYLSNGVRTYMVVNLNIISQKKNLSW